MDIFKPIELFSNWFVYALLGLNRDISLGQSLHFFIYDSIKILLLLITINYFMAIVRYYLPIEKLRDFLASHKFYGFDHLLASIFGSITPFCSCSSIPLFIGFLKAGIPLGVTLSFLITSPLVNQAAVVIFLGIFGWKITLIYLLAGISIGIFGGIILGRLKLEKYLADYVLSMNVNNVSIEKEKKPPFVKLLGYFFSEAWGITKKIMPYVLIGVGLGAIIHGFVPTNYFESYISKGNILAVPLAVIIGIPMYANITGIVPIIQALVVKGIPLGTAMAFMMAVVGLSFPEAMILKTVMKTRLLITFFITVGMGIILIGYLFNIFI